MSACTWSRRYTRYRASQSALPDLVTASKFPLPNPPLFLCLRPRDDLVATIAGGTVSHCEIAPSTRRTDYPETCVTVMVMRLA